MTIGIDVDRLSIESIHGNIAGTTMASVLADLDEDAVFVGAADFRGVCTNETRKVTLREGCEGGDRCSQDADVGFDHGPVHSIGDSVGGVGRGEKHGNICNSHD